jgi:hypothetical protein
MPLPRKRAALQLTEEERIRLESIRRSRTEEKRRTVRAALLLDSLAGHSDEVIARRHHVKQCRNASFLFSHRNTAPG